MMMRAGRSTLLVVVVLTVAACGGGDDDAAPTTTVAVTTSAPATTSPTTTAPPTTTTPPTTAPALTTAPPTTAPPATTAAPVTTAVVTDLRAEIEAALNRREAAMFEIGADPASPDLAANLAEYLSGTAYDKTLTFFQELASQGFVLQPNPAVASTVVVTGEPIILSEDPRRVQVDICWIDAGVIADPPDVAGGATFIVNDAVARLTVVTELVFDGDGWIQDSWERLADDQLGVASCE